MDFGIGVWLDLQQPAKWVLSVKKKQKWGKMLTLRHICSTKKEEYNMST